MKENWYVLHTKPKWEQKVVNALLKKRINGFSPFKFDDMSNGRKGIADEPLFPAFVFVQISDERQLQQVKKMEGVLNLIYWLDKPIVIPDEEIETIQATVKGYAKIRLEKSNVKPGAAVEVLSQQTNLLAGEQKDVKISLPTLGYIMIAAKKEQQIHVISASAPLSRFTLFQINNS